MENQDVNGSSSAPRPEDANLARIALRELEGTMDRLIEVDGRALALAARAGNMYLNGEIPANQQAEVVTAMEQVVNSSMDARKVISQVGRMVALSKVAQETNKSAEEASSKTEDAQTAGEQQRIAVKRQRRLSKMRL